MDIAKIFASTLLTTLLLVSANSNAETISCNGCTSQEMKEAAEKELLSVAWSSPHPPLYVTNTHNNIVKKYHYQSNYGPGFDWENDGLETWVIEGQVEQSIINLINNIHADARVTRTLPPLPNLPNSAWDVISSIQNDEKVISYIEGHLVSYRARANQYVIALNPIPNHFKPSEIRFSTEINFPDGSKAIYEFNQKTEDWERKKNSSRDKHGNLIPESKLDYSGGDGSIREYQYPLGSSDLSNFLDRAQTLGITTINGGGGGSTVKVACVDAGGNIVCEILIM